MPNIKLIISVINYLKAEARREASNPDTQESLEVAVQCLQTAYDLDPKDNRFTKSEPAFALEDIFNRAVAKIEEEIALTQAEIHPIGNNPVDKAETMKNLGNNLMKKEDFDEAIRYYTAAIELNGKVAVYYCNRAAAHSKLNDFQSAIKDCEKAVEIDPKYAKAYSRMGLAHSSLEQYALAVKAFEKAVQLDPSNESYVHNLHLAVEKAKQPSNPVGGLSGMNNVDWQSLFNNPAIRNMASTIMQDPNIINALSGGMNNMLNQAAAANVPPPPTTTTENSSAPPNLNPGAGPLDMLLEAGQYLASQMTAANPDLVEQFRQQTRNLNPDLVEQLRQNTPNPNPDKKDPA